MGVQKFTDEELLKCYYNPEYDSNVKIAKALGVTKSAVGKRLKKLGIFRRIPDKKIFELHKKGLSNTKISHKLGIRLETVGNRLESLGLKRNIPTKINNEDWYSLYLKGYSDYKISNFLNVATTTINNQTNKYNLYSNYLINSNKNKIIKILLESDYMISIPKISQLIRRGYPGVLNYLIKQSENNLNIKKYLIYQAKISPFIRYTIESTANCAIKSHEIDNSVKIYIKKIDLESTWSKMQEHVYDTIIDTWLSISSIMGRLDKKMDYINITPQFLSHQLRNDENVESKRKDNGYYLYRLKQTDSFVIYI